jgi:hypothetical protein
MLFGKEIELLKSRYPYILFKFDNLELINREINYLEKIGRSNGNYLGFIFREIAEYCFLNYSSNWCKICPVTTSAMKPDGWIEPDLPGNWLQLRKICYERDGGKCQRCGLLLIDKKYHVHHLTARSIGGDDHIDNLATLCIDCHSIQGGRHSEITIKKYDLIDFLDKINPNISISFDEMNG